jgi:hypothetical protein
MISEREQGDFKRVVLTSSRRSSTSNTCLCNSRTQCGIAMSNAPKSAQALQGSTCHWLDRKMWLLSLVVLSLILINTVRSVEPISAEEAFDAAFNEAMQIR